MCGQAQQQQQPLHDGEMLPLQPNLNNNDKIDDQYHRQQQQQLQRLQKSFQKRLPSELWFQIIEYLLDHTGNNNNTNTCSNSINKSSCVSRRYRSSYTKRTHHYNRTNQLHNSINNEFYRLISLSETNHYFNRLCSIYIQRYWKRSKSSIIESSTSTTATSSDSSFPTHQQVNDPYNAYYGIIQRLHHVDYNLAQQLEQQYICFNDDNQNTCHNGHRFPCDCSTNKYPIRQYYHQFRTIVINPVLYLLPHLAKWLRQRQHKYVSRMNRHPSIIRLLIVVALFDLFDNNNSNSFDSDIMKLLLTIVMVRTIYAKDIIMYYNVRRSKRYYSSMTSSSQPLYSKVYVHDNATGSSNFMSQPRLTVTNQYKNGGRYNDVHCIQASSNSSSSSISVVMHPHRSTNHDTNNDHYLRREQDCRRQAHGWIGMYHRAIQLAKKRIIHVVQEERFNTYKALNVLERDALSSSFINACSSDSTLHIVKSLAKSLPTQDFYIDDDGFESCALHTAAFHGSAQVIDFLCRNIDTSYYSDGDIATKMNMSTRSIHYNDGGLCDVNVTDMNGWTALHYAVGANSVETIRTLIKCGASYNISTLNGYTPYQWAVRLKHYAVADELQAIMSKDQNQHNVEHQQHETDRWWTFLDEVLRKFLLKE